MINRPRVLYDEVLATCGKLTKVAKHPLDPVPPPEESVLKEVPGAYEAWRGLSSLDLKVCAVRGLRASSTQRTSSMHPISVSEEVRGLEREHSKYEVVLVVLATAITPNPSEDDPRPEQEHQPESTPTEYSQFEFVGTLQARAPNLVGNVATSDKDSTMLRGDSRHEVWLLLEE